MSKDKLSPVEALQRQRVRLQVKSDALTNVMEENFVYLQENLGPLLGQATLDAVSSKLPPFVQNLLNGDRGSDNQGSSSRKEGILSNLNLSKYESLADQAIDIAPYFMKGAKGIVFAFLLKKLRNLIFKKRK